MKTLEGQVRIPAGCAISGFINKDGTFTSGARILQSIRVMHERSNGLGGGFAGYGIYPQYKELYALHVFYDGPDAKTKCEAYINERFEVENLSKIPTNRHKNITDTPLIWRYFVTPLHNRLVDSQLTEKEYVVHCVHRINTKIDGAYVFSSGKNMGVFKGVGFPEDIGEFYGIESYEGYAWTAHGRYPTNTPGWWGGAHPFSLLDYSIVHNGEISSYDTNRRHIEMFGYKCTLLTDTEVITYIFDYLNRVHGLPLEEIQNIIASPFWSDIDKIQDPEEKEKLTAYRRIYSSLLITGPFSIILGFNGGLMALNDRLKLRSMVAGTQGQTTYFASEEAAIRAVASPEKVWAIEGGKALIARLNEGVNV